MKFLPTEITGAYIVGLEKHGDERGFFARSFDTEIFSSNDLESVVVQCNFSYSEKAGTLRGMHFQKAPHQEAKLIRCIKGMIFDSLIDMRPDSATYLQWIGVELSSDNRLSLYAPPGTAHGFITLADQTEVTYQVSAPYKPELEGGLRWNDPAFGIKWPIQPVVMSDKDQNWPLFNQ